MSTLAQEKALLRQRIRAEMQAMPTEERRRSDQALIAQVLAQETIQQANCILLYHGVGMEPPVGELIAPLLERGKTVCLPVCLPKRQMEARQVWEGCPMKVSAFGIPEPGEECPTVSKEQVDVILVPGLCCDVFGYRLGQGGGYYDRYLADYEGSTLCLCREKLLQGRLPREWQDWPVQVIVTEQGRLVPQQEKGKAGESPAFPGGDACC